MIKFRFSTNQKSVEGFGPLYSYITSYIILILLTLLPVVMIPVYLITGANSQNDSLISCFQLDKLGIRVCSFFWLLDYITQGILVSVLITFSTKNL
jgi:hypothetical protein